MYAPYHNPHQSQDYGYYAPEPYQNQGPPTMNPFVANPGPRRKRNRKQKDVTLPVVPQPGTTTAPVAVLASATIPAPVPAKPADPAEGQQLEWVLVPKGTPVATSSSTVATPPVEPEPEKVSDKLADAQKEVNRLQWIVENSLIILVEPRRAYPIVEFGLLDAYLPSERIEVVAAVTTLTSIFLSGYWFFQKQGLPDKQENRVLGRAHDHTYFNLKGVLSGFTNLNHLSPAEQNRRLAEYETDLQRVVRAFLALFVGHQTMHRTPAIMLKIGAPSTILHKYLLQCSYSPPGFMVECKERFTIFSSLHAMQDHDPTTLAETVRQNLEELKGPLENRTTVLKALGIHMRDLTAAAAYLETASDPIPWPTPSELENWAGITSMERQTELIDDIQSSVTTNQIELEKMSVLMRALLKKMQQGDATPIDAVPEPTAPATDHEGVELPPEDDVISSDED